MFIHFYFIHYLKENTFFMICYNKTFPFCENCINEHNSAYFVNKEKHYPVIKKTYTLSF